MRTIFCPVCGYNLSEEAQDGLNEAVICPSCGMHFGYYDAAPTDEGREAARKEWRERWIKEGMKWSHTLPVRPEDWDPKKQLLNIGIDLDKTK